ncbi:MAG: 7,8-didemethyl-8-hydroxy-5-deazariboflavin synthase subunit CofG [Blastocatellia bacterium AA13]|nr:MAG: 7,8-didemethyl-8-hydroxy-5-deazariboflavin synthase subunit CofG [Blastocatellia bacterium AA13]
MSSVTIRETISFEEAFEQAKRGEVSVDAARVLIRPADRVQTERLLGLAAETRDRLKGKIISYSKKVFIPLTNLCRDYCGYCTFRKDPGERGAATMSPDEVLAVANAGKELGCKEALFSLGDRPEAIFPEMRETLQSLGHRTTLSYLLSICELVLNETGLLPHVNPGLMARADIEAFRRLSPSMGLMLENVSDRFASPGMAHDNAPDKIPSLRLRTIEEAGRQKVPFTTGILIGIGETLDERIDALEAIRFLHKTYGHIQEVIVQNFRAKTEIPMRNHPEPSLLDHARTIAVARLMMPDVNIQAPPNLSDENYPLLIHAGINDWGGISPLTRDFINPEKPWPHIEDLGAKTADKGYELKERLSVYPEYLGRGEYIDASLIETIRAMADDRGYAA